MAKGKGSRGELARVRAQLVRWRQQHGGRGRAIPEELWAAAAAVAAVEGVQTTALALGVDRERLSRRVTRRCEAGPRTKAAGAAPPSASFVELEAQRVFAGGRAVVRVTSPAGGQLEIALEGSTLDITAVMQAFWRVAR